MLSHLLQAVLHSRLAGPVQRLALRVVRASLARQELVAPAQAFLATGGYRLLKDDYHIPVPTAAELQLADRPSELVGISLDAEQAVDWAERTVCPYLDEFLSFPLEAQDDPAAYHIVNGSFMAVDGAVYYGVLRHHRPRRIVEIGAGASTLLAAAALRRNVADGAPPTEYLVVEPYPRPTLRSSVPEISELRVCPVQDVPLAELTRLSAGDVLFIDSTHVLKSGSDVWWEFCEVLPRLPQGVLVHIHDIMLPYPYPREYAGQGWYWNEQYLLQAFLTFNSRFRILWPGNWLGTKRPELMKEWFRKPYQKMLERYPGARPASFWMEVTSQA